MKFLEYRPKQGSKEKIDLKQKPDDKNAMEALNRLYDLWQDIAFQDVIANIVTKLSS